MDGFSNQSLINLKAFVVTLFDLSLYRYILDFFVFGVRITGSFPIHAKFFYGGKPRGIARQQASCKVPAYFLAFKQPEFLVIFFHFLV